MKNKLVLSSHNLDANSVQSHLKEIVTQESMDNIISLLKICDAGKYAPDGLEKEATILSDMKEMMKQIDKEIG